MEPLTSIDGDSNQNVRGGTSSLSRTMCYSEGYLATGVEIRDHFEIRTL